MVLIENDCIGLIPYTHEDDRDMYLCWQDKDTQKGYNGRFDMTFEEFQNAPWNDIRRFKFWVTAVDKRTKERVGVLRLGLDESCPDLAIWMYPAHRNKGYGTQAYQLALQYIFDTYDYKEISAGCFVDNTYSRRMLTSIGFVRYPQGDETEINCFTGETTVQQEYRISKDSMKGSGAEESEMG